MELQTSNNNNKEMLFPDNESSSSSSVVTATVTITFVTDEAPNGFLQKGVNISKYNNTKLSELTHCALELFNKFLNDNKYSFRLNDKDTNYTVIASADNKIKNYTMDNQLKDFELLDFAFNYKVSNLISAKSEKKFKCLCCICF
jgi:hypothetical protein